MTFESLTYSSNTSASLGIPIKGKDVKRVWSKPSNASRFDGLVQVVVTDTNVYGVSVPCISPDGRNLYTPENEKYAINSISGELTLSVPAPSTVGGSSATKMIVSPNGNFAFAVASAGDIRLYRRNQAGLLTYIGGHATAQRSIGIHPSGACVYAVDYNSSLVHSVSIDSSGSTVTRSSISVTGAPTDCVVSSCGSFAYVCCYSASQVKVYSIDKSTLNLYVLLQTIAAGSNPYYGGLCLSTDNRFLYCSCASGSSVYSYAVDNSTGLLTLAQIVASGSSTGHISISPDGNMAIVAAQGVGHNVYTRNPIDGVLTFSYAITGLTGTPLSSIFSPDGKFAYLRTSNRIYVYSRS